LKPEEGKTQRDSTFIAFMRIETYRMLNDSEGSQAGPDYPSGKVLWKPVKKCEAEEILMESGMF
jgi:hypothetical protein